MNRTCNICDLKQINGTMVLEDPHIQTQNKPQEDRQLHTRIFEGIDEKESMTKKKQK